MPRQLKGLVFDLDGTLLNTLEGHGRSFNRALAGLSMPEQDIDNYRYYIGDGAAQCARQCLPDNFSSDKTLIEQCVRLFRDDYADTWYDCTSPYPGIMELLESLSRMSIPLAVLSNKDDKFTQEMIHRCFPDNTFCCIAGFGYQSLVRHKPDPSGPRLIAERLGCTTGNLAMVGDTATDMKTANFCDMIPIGVLWGYRTRQELVEAGAQHIISSPHELLLVMKTGF